MKLQLGVLLLFLAILTACSNNEQSSNEVQERLHKKAKKRL